MLQSQPLTNPIRPSWTLWLLRPLGRLWLWGTGFTVVGEMPNVPKFVVVAAPHTTNWDLPYTIAAGLHYGRRMRWMGKTSIFKWPFGGVMRWLGGLPIDRSKSNNAVASVVETFEAADTLYLVIAPAGTRGVGKPWKSGFYHIAHGANVPLVLTFCDYKSKTLGVAEVFQPTGDYERDVIAIRAVYARVLGRDLF